MLLPPGPAGSQGHGQSLRERVPLGPVCTSPSRLGQVAAAGFPTTIHPPCVWVVLLSFPVTVKWQKPGVLPAVTVISPGCAGVIAAVVRLIVSPVHAVAPSNASTTADDNVKLVANCPIPHSRRLSGGSEPFCLSIGYINHFQNYLVMHGVHRPGLVWSRGIPAVWPALGSANTELGVFMGPEVGHGETKVYAGVQA